MHSSLIHLKPISRLLPARPHKKPHLSKQIERENLYSTCAVFYIQIVRSSGITENPPCNKLTSLEA